MAGVPCQSTGSSSACSASDPALHACILKGREDGPSATHMRYAGGIPGSWLYVDLFDDLEAISGSEPVDLRSVSLSFLPLSLLLFFK